MKILWRFSLSLLSLLILLSVINIGMTTCTMGSEDAWLVLLLFGAPIIILISVLVYLCRNTEWNMWLIVPVVVLAVFSFITVSKYLYGVTLQGNHFCTVLKGHDFNSYQNSWWAPYWAPAMLVALTLLLAAYLSTWFKLHSSEK